MIAIGLANPVTKDSTDSSGFASNFVSHESTNRYLKPTYIVPKNNEQVEYVHERQPALIPYFTTNQNQSTKPTNRIPPNPPDYHPVEPKPVSKRQLNPQACPVEKSPALTPKKSNPCDEFHQYFLSCGGPEIREFHVEGDVIFGVVNCMKGSWGGVFLFFFLALFLLLSNLFKSCYEFPLPPMSEKSIE